ANARLALGRIAEDPGLSEVLRNDDIRRELRPARRDFGSLHLEDDRAVGVGDDAAPALPDDLVERSASGEGVATIEGNPLFQFTARLRRRARRSGLIARYALHRLFLSHNLRLRHVEPPSKTRDTHPYRAGIARPLRPRSRFFRGPSTPGAGGQPTDLNRRLRPL